MLLLPSTGHRGELKQFCNTVPIFLVFFLKRKNKNKCFGLKAPFNWSFVYFTWFNLHVSQISVQSYVAHTVVA